jgi:hypothetical protein
VTLSGKSDTPTLGQSGAPRMTDLEAEACRAALCWRRKYEDLWDAVDAYRLWEPRRKGYAAARRELERVWRGEDED